MDIIYVPSIDISTYLVKLFDFSIDNYKYIFVIINKVLTFIATISIPFSLVLVIGIIISVEGIKRIRKEEDQILNFKVVPAYISEKTGARGNTAVQWEKIHSSIDSTNPNDWKQAIIEADVILGQLLETIGYKGETIGDKLKRAESSDFKSLNQAWEAHKVRNNIAHEGAFALSHHEARRVISLYKQVFDEFEII